MIIKLFKSLFPVYEVIFKNKKLIVGPLPDYYLPAFFMQNYKEYKNDYVFLMKRDFKKRICCN